MGKRYSHENDPTTVRIIGSLEKKKERYKSFSPKILKYFDKCHEGWKKNILTHWLRCPYTGISMPFFYYPIK